MSNRVGLSEPSDYIINDLRIGTIINVKFGNKPNENEFTPATMMVSALVSKDDDDQSVFALLTPHTTPKFNTTGLHCFLAKENGDIKIGTIISARSLLGDNSPNLGFHVLKIEADKQYGDIIQKKKPLAITKDFKSHVWRAGNFKLRRVNDENGVRISGSQSAQGLRKKWVNKIGLVDGDMRNVEIENDDNLLYYNYCGTISPRKGRIVTDSTAVGAPVISRSGALSGIIVGKHDEDTLVFPIEHITKYVKLIFLTLGEDWPKLKISARYNRIMR